MGYGVVLVTASSKTEAEAIAQTLIQANLAACVNIMPIHSLYTWQGKVQQEEEWQLFIKTNLSHFSALEAKVKQVHSYDVPEIIALPILTGSQPYLQWIAEQTNTNL